MSLLRVATFNLLHGMSLADGATRAADLRAAVRTIDADVLGIQEVDLAQPRSGGVDQTALVGEAMGADGWRFVPTVAGTPGESWLPAAADRDQVGPAVGAAGGPPGASTVGSSGSDGASTGTADRGPSYGLGLVSRLPVLRWQVLRFPAVPVPLPLLVPSSPPRLMLVPDEPRAAVAAVVQTTQGPVTVVTAHLSFVPVANAWQLRRLVRWLRPMPRPLFLAGDLNMIGPVPRLVTGWQALATAATYPSTRPRVQFDHVLAHGLPRGSVRQVSVARVPISDHRPLSVDVDLPAPRR